MADLLSQADTIVYKMYNVGDWGGYKIVQVLETNQIAQLKQYSTNNRIQFPFDVYGAKAKICNFQFEQIQLHTKFEN